ncbi:transcriptional regulator [Lederbergia lenta]|uniref:Transcriptional regulator n=1 Tax=Lederbergia lenta TaxID=1467 RepID=A0A2X4WJZ7_LEDLE|nr:transcriptional regulator [Lederbergia lenta]
MGRCTRVHKVLEGISLAKRKDVAKLAGVSEATISRVFNNVGPIREETKQKVLKAAKTLNYQPNALAQSFATGKSGNIGVIIPYLPKVHLLSTHYFSGILSGIGIQLGKCQYNLLVMFQSPHEPKDYVQLFRSQKIDGCIILGAKNDEQEIKEIERLHELKLPYCLVNQTYEGYPFHSVDAKHTEGSFQAVSLLLEKGFKRIAFINGPLEYSNSMERLKGYRDAYLNVGIEPPSELVFQGNYSRTSGIQLSTEIAPLMSNIDAIFSGNDRMAIGLMQGLSKHGYHVGEDYALIGYDNSDVASMVQPQLTSVQVPLLEMGEMAAEKVLNELNGKSVVLQERLPVTLIERASIQVKKEMRK